ncbi:MAG: glutaredoxin family protein [Elusimicrobia bacterium]|nr:glutaredoxin family protein [Elusimicrobiota bacterium]
MYTLSTCLWCKKTKKYFEEKNIPFEAVEYDKQDEVRQEEISKEIRASGCPVTFPFVKIGGECTQGYNPNEFETLLEKK